VECLSDDDDSWNTVMVFYRAVVDEKRNMSQATIETNRLIAAQTHYRQQRAWECLLAKRHAKNRHEN
jgi:hypothetical protein